MDYSSDQGIECLWLREHLSPKTKNITKIYIYDVDISHVFELRVETKFEVCDPDSFFVLHVSLGN